MGGDVHRDVRPERPRIFGIGLNKTGTSSLHEALTLLGFQSLHDGGPEVHDAVKRAVDAAEPLLTHLDPRFDAFSDIGLLSRRFRMLDQQYPGSRFVLTVRPIDEWVDSRRRHVERNIADKAIGTYHGTFLTIDEPKWRDEWDHHVNRVRDYFQGRADFLEIDITRGASWQPFCGLLGVTEPAAAFPWANRDEAVHGSTSG
jgi:hypothetical protein